MSSNGRGRRVSRQVNILCTPHSFFFAIFRFRRDLDDGGELCCSHFWPSYEDLALDASSRPSFRSTLSQPSQMGNFKHQSLRSGDRERDGDRDRDREIRDKEGLRHVGIS